MKKSICMFLLTAHIAYPEQSFIIKKKKPESLSTIKNNCCDAYSQLLELTAQLIEQCSHNQLVADKKLSSSITLIKELAAVQQQLLRTIRLFIEGDRSHFLSQATKVQLIECNNKTNHIHEILTTCHTKLSGKTIKESELNTVIEDVKKYNAYIISQ